MEGEGEEEFSMNLYQKYRPYRFQDVVGQVKTINELKKRAIDNNFPQVMIFSGPTGTGKTTIARIIASYLNCSNPKEGEPCGECRSCKAIQEENVISDNLLEFDARDIKVDEIEKIKSFCSTQSLLGGKKIVFIDEFQGIVGQGSSASARDKTLKLFEKVYKDVYFILGTMNWDSIPKEFKEASKGRMSFYKLSPLTSSEIVGRLYDICEKENVVLTNDKSNGLMTIAENSQGSLRIAISYLERAIYGDIWSEEELLEELDIVSNQTVIDLVVKLVKRDTSILQTHVNETIFNQIEELILATIKKQMGGYLNKTFREKIGRLDQLPQGRLLELMNLVQDTKKYGFLTMPMITLFLIKALQEETRRTR